MTTFLFPNSRAVVLVLFFLYLSLVPMLFRISFCSSQASCIQITIPRFVSAPFRPRITKNWFEHYSKEIKYLWDFPLKADFKFKRLLWLLYLLINNILRSANIPPALSSLSDITSRLWKLLTFIVDGVILFLLSFFLYVFLFSFVSFHSLNMENSFFTLSLVCGLSKYFNHQARKMSTCFRIVFLAETFVYMNVISYGMTTLSTIYSTSSREKCHGMGDTEKSGIYCQRNAAYCFIDMPFLSFEWSNSWIWMLKCVANQFHRTYCWRYIPSHFIESKIYTESSIFIDVNARQMKMILIFGRIVESLNNFRFSHFRYSSDVYLFRIGRFILENTHGTTNENFNNRIEFCIPLSPGLTPSSPPPPSFYLPYIVPSFIWVSNYIRHKVLSIYLFSHSKYHKFSNIDVRLTHVGILFVYL